MKKLSIFSIALATAAVCSATEVMSGNTIGVQNLTLSRNITLISVPWNEMGGSTAVSVATLINPDQFNNNSDVRLYVPNGDNYAVYKIVNNAWTSEGTATIGSDGTASAASGESVEKTLARGGAAWLSVPASLKTMTCYQAGEYTTDDASVTLSTGYNLVASPKGEAYDLANLAGKGADGDIVTVPGVSGADFVLKNKSGTWKYQKTTSGVTSWAEITTGVASVPAGCGFWYYSKAGGTLSL